MSGCDDPAGARHAVALLCQYAQTRPAELSQVHPTHITAAASRPRGGNWGAGSTQQFGFGWGPQLLGSTTLPAFHDPLAQAYHTRLCHILANSPEVGPEQVRPRSLAPRSQIVR